jgi:uncharacterized protein with PQ loop repeat
MKIIGWLGSALVVVAYYPQIHHLFVKRCAWGISVSTWVIWLLASVLLLIYCILRQEVLLGVVQATNMAAILTTIILVRRSNYVCPDHWPDAEGIAESGKEDQIPLSSRSQEVH